MTQPIAILCSDLHFSHRPPVARSAEPDWYGVMARHWELIQVEAEEASVPIIIAGDIFDFWKSPPQLTNFVIRLFQGTGQRIYAIPGQHDLPNHNYDEIHRSSYGTLIEARAMTHLIPGKSYELRDDGGLMVWGFPWGYEIDPVDEGDFQPGHNVKLAVCHQYVWTAGHKYPGASELSRLGALKTNLVGYDAAVFGDNHKGFVARSGSCNVMNCGGFISRKQDERDYRPGYGILYDDGTIDRVHFLTDQDKWIEPEEQTDIAAGMDFSGLVDELEGLGADALDFTEALNRFFETNKTDPEVKASVLKSLDEARSYAT